MWDASRWREKNGLEFKPDVGTAYTKNVWEVKESARTSDAEVLDSIERAYGPDVRREYEALLAPIRAPETSRVDRALAFAAASAWLAALADGA